jgi:hypothetical protein
VRVLPSNLVTLKTWRGMYNLHSKTLYVRMSQSLKNQQRSLNACAGKGVIRRTYGSGIIKSQTCWVHIVGKFAQRKRKLNLHLSV